MASRLVKAYKVIENDELKIVSFQKDEQIEPEEESLSEEERQIDLVQLKLDHERELTQQKEQAQKELAEWKKREEETFLVELEEEKRRGYQEGYQIGMDEGRDHGLEEYRELIDKAKGLLEQSYKEKIAVIKEAEPFVIKLSVEIAKKILQQELTANEEALLPMIKETLASVYESSSLSIHVAPNDYPFVQKQREQLMAVVNGKLEVKIIPDYSIQHGGCMIHTSSGSVDARIDVQLSEIKKALLAYYQEESRE